MLLKAILSTDVLTRAEQEIKWMEKEGINHLFYSDKHFNGYEIITRKMQ